MKIISWNVNGLRAVYKRNFSEILKNSEADLFCIQEAKAQESDIPPELISIKGYSTCYNLGNRKGYSGVIVFAKQPPVKTSNTLGHTRFDSEGRFLRLDYATFSLINLYLPNGGRDKHDYDYKIEVYDRLIEYLSENATRPLIIVGDFNIAHMEIDLARPKENKNSIMFTALERQKLSNLFSLGYIDTFRSIHPEGNNYTWWPYYYSARERNLGWRIDYILISTSLKKFLTSAFILPMITGSDHCPTGITQSLTFI